MTSQVSKQEANCRNARRSTGPRTEAGKARSRRNAMRHGLACVSADPNVGREILQLTRAIAAGSGDSCRLHWARMAAEAEYELRRSSAAAIAIMDSTGLGRQGAEPSTMVQQLLSLERYHSRAHVRKKRALLML